MSRYDEDGEFLIDGVGFANEGSALRAATKNNPRNKPCPKCKAKNVLTRLDVQASYVCDRCADKVERGFDY
jgi:uncharacterized paraquat-inducible protein A